MEKKRQGKKGQVMGMPFQFIFAAIIVIVTILVGFFVIKHFLSVAETANINDFVNRVQVNVEDVWQQHEEASKLVELGFSTKFYYVCFVNRNNCNLREGIVPNDLCSNIVPTFSNTDKDNLFLYPGGKAEEYSTKTAWHIACGSKECLNVTKTICLPVEKGKVAFRLVKEAGQPVKIARP